MQPYRRNIYDRLSEQRVAKLEQQRLIKAQVPIGEYTSDGVIILNAWVWLPGGVFDTPLPANKLARMRADFDHDPRLLDARGLRRPIRRLETPGIRFPAVDCAGRAGEILSTVFAKWSKSFYTSIDWETTQIVLFAPTSITPIDWFAQAINMWPRDQLPGYGFDVQSQPPSQWLPQILTYSAGAECLLCLSLDSWACNEQMLACAEGEMVGEAVSAVLLQRQSNAYRPDSNDNLKLYAPELVQHPPRASQSRQDIEALQQILSLLIERSGIETARLSVLIGDGELADQRLQQLYAFAQSSLPNLDLEVQVRLNAISGRIGIAAEQWVQIGLAWLVASAEPGSAAWVLERRQSDLTQGWLIG
ncbi:hypothetical protein ACXX81_17780 [Pseudomonas sp. GNP013]